MAKKLDYAFDAEVLKLAARPEGVSAIEVSREHPGAVVVAIKRLLKAGAIFKAVAGHKTVRYFIDIKVAQAFDRQSTASGVVIHSKRSKDWAPDAPMVITENTKYTIAPPPPERPLKTNTHWQF